MTLQQRIAALNATHVGRVPSEPLRPVQVPDRATPQVPNRRPNIVKHKSINNPPEHLNGSITDTRIGNKPAPPPLPSRKKPLELPSRKDSGDSERRPSVESTTSVYTNGSVTTTANTSRSTSSERVKAPAWGDCELPVLPPKGQVSTPRKYSSDRPKYVNRAPSSATTTTTTTTTTTSIDSRRPSQSSITPVPALPALPPRRPTRKAEVEHHEHVPQQEARKLAPVPSTDYLAKAQRSALSFGFNNKPKTQEPAEQDALPPVAHRQTTSLTQAPPVPLSSRPDLSALQATKPKFGSSTSMANGASQTQSNVCMTCRDFSGPDRHASRFPRQQVSSLQDLAYQLTSPFASLTDKARALFTWLHHNVAYDVDNFFGGTVQRSTPQSTLQTGLAVCEGYAALFSNLAMYAGLESVVISGHGKGYGYTPLAPGSPLPPYKSGHAWNAVKIDDNEWKVIDACWGAGHVQGKGMPYVPKFSPECFNMSNEEFGVKHFPGNKDHFFLPGNRRLSWEEYIQINPEYWPGLVEAPTIYGAAKDDYYIGSRTVTPRIRNISVNSGGVSRFQFQLRCPHWTLNRHGDKGPAPVFIIAVQGVDGRNKDYVPMEYIRGGSEGGDTWYADINSKELGAPGQTVTCFAVTGFGDRAADRARGLTVQEFRQGKGRVSMGFQGVAAWQLVQ